ncbi:cuticle protein 2-like [Rhopalosiphum maidis]|uniref:cuticle protein 2-like n=1 Tax=Rhopalosiphum maidis TaxID=43146 RepID=UPI000EFFBC0E|nr:cuticle protein 2-like [Rhopalosiphum maidis]
MMKTNIEQRGPAMSIGVQLLVVGVLVSACAAYSGDEGSADYFRGHEPRGVDGNRQLPVILMHKQALQEDGGFQYAFAADNGLRQGESIRPDGSRTGAYSYTDPDGKEISVKYTAGKDGFRIIQGDHVPKAPVSVVPLQQQSSAPAYAPPSPGRSLAKNRLFGAPGGPGSQFSRGDFNGGGRFDHNSGEAFGSPSPYKSKYSKPQQHYRVREDNSAELAARYDDDGSAFDGAGDYSSHSPFRAPSTQAHATYNGASANSEKDDGSFNSNERQPHSFGSGYAFEFGGSNNNGGASPEY